MLFASMLTSVRADGWQAVQGSCSEAASPDVHRVSCVAVQLHVTGQQLPLGAEPDLVPPHEGMPRAGNLHVFISVKHQPASECSQAGRRMS